MKVAGEIETYKGGLGDTAMQRAWMRYADEQKVPHDHADEEPFKYGFDAGRNFENTELLRWKSKIGDMAITNAKKTAALKNLYNAVQKSRSVNDPLGMATAMEEAGEWF